MSKPDPTLSKSTAALKKRTARRRFRTVRLAFLLLILALISLAEPRIFQFVVRQLIAFEAWRSGISIQVSRIDSSVFEPLVVRDSRWDYQSPAGVATHMEIARAEARFNWQKLLTGGTERWFEALNLNGVSGRITLPGNAPLQEPAAKRAAWRAMLDLPRERWVPSPTQIQAHGVDLIVENQANSIRLDQVRFKASELEPGFIRIGRVTIDEPWLKRSFRDVRGTTGLNDSKLWLANIVLEPGIEISSLTAGVTGLAKGRLNMDVAIEAFGGKIRFGALSQPDSHPLTFDVNGTFDSIDIAKLAIFLRLSDAAGGTIRNGTFGFSGAPRDLDKATASIWLDATNFQWESRQWDSLALGASLMDKRMQVSKLDLIQGHNRLNLSGEMALPLPGVKWWQSEFTCNVAATIENLTELSALLLPEFQYAAGKANIDGSIRGRNEQFNGQLIVSGSKLTWHNAPIENLHAALKLSGNECQISNVELFNNGDYVRGRGVVNILGDLRYSGDLRASIEDLATYAAILQKPIVPEPLAGGAIIEWSGDGSAKGHNGKILARLNKVRSLGALASQLHPLNIDIDGSYTQGAMQFSRFALSDDESSFSANVGIGNKALSLKQIRLTHGDQVALVGDALLAIDLWQAWPNTSLATLLKDDTVSEVNLTATQLDLARASKLAGWNFPIAGIVDGALTVSGAINALKTGGKLAVIKGRLPLGWKGDSLSDVEAVTTFQGAEITVESFTARQRFGDVQLSGTIGLQNAREPQLHLQLTSANSSLPLFDSGETAQPISFGTDGAIQRPRHLLLDTALDLKIEGTTRAATLQGEARIHKVDLAAVLNLNSLWKSDAIPAPGLPPIFAFTGTPWSAWQLNINCQTEAPLPLADNPGSVDVKTRVTGTCAEPQLEGTVEFEKVLSNPSPFWTVADPTDQEQRWLMVENATLVFQPDRSRNPTVDLHASGAISGESFDAYVVGPVTHLVHFFATQPPLTDALVQQLLAGEQADDSADSITLAAPALFTRDIQVFEWAPIESAEGALPPSEAAQPPAAEPAQ
ncbi:MAG: hypothetical protein JWL90_2059 [Chthoniobacteraceae bacterium]|nr:hypothetical protein [Chthoniobacteraceae bacterium]